MSKSTWPAHRLTHTLPLFVCGLVTSQMLLWLGLNKSCHHSTRQQRRWPNAAPHCRIPVKGSELFFSLLNQPLSAVWALDFGGNIHAWQHSAMYAPVERASQCWNPKLRSRSHNRNTGAVLVQRAVGLPHVEREVQRRKKLGTKALRTLAWITGCAEWTWIFFSSAVTRRDG